LVAAEIRIITGSANNRIIQNISFFLSDPEVSVITQFPTAIVPFETVYNVVEVLSCPVIDRIRFDPQTRVGCYDVGRR
jgi:hypothetical protein